MKLRIAITCREHIINLGGVNKFIFTLADGLSCLGHEVHIVCYSSREQNSTIKGDLKTLFGFEGNAHMHTLTDGSKTEQWPHISLTWATSGRELLKKLDVDAVIVNGIVPLSINRFRIVVNHGFNPTNKLQLGLTGSAVGWKGFKDITYSLLSRYLYKTTADCCVCVSRQLQHEFNAFMNLDSIVIPLPIKIHLFKNLPITERENLILHIGARPIKNMEVSIKAVKTLVEKLQVDAKLVIVGHKNDLVDQLATKYKDLIPKHLDFIGDANSITINNLLSHAKALLLPSEYESFSYVVLEAFASGVPVVVSDAVPRELVSNGCTGFVIPDFDSQQYALKLSNLLLNASLWKTFSENAIRKSNEFSYLTIAKKYENLISNFHKQNPIV